MCFCVRFVVSFASQSPIFRFRPSRPLVKKELVKMERGVVVRCRKSRKQDDHLKHFVILSTCRWTDCWKNNFSCDILMRPHWFDIWRKQTILKRRTSRALRKSDLKVSTLERRLARTSSTDSVLISNQRRWFLFSSLASHLYLQSVSFSICLLALPIRKHIVSQFL